MGSLSKETILVLHKYADSTWRAQSAGLRHFALMRGWRLRILQMEGESDLASIAREIETVGPTGIITSIEKALPEEVTGGMPTVYFDCQLGMVPPDAPFFCHDASVTAHLAACELFRAGFKSFSFVSFPGEWYWSRNREEAFAKEVRARGGDFLPSLHFPSNESPSALRLSMDEWVRSLPKPCGVFAANDKSGAMLLKVCRDAGVAVPGEVAVVGVDNNLPLCMSAKPTLTSIVPDWWGGAFMAAEALDKMIRGKKVEARQTFRPLGLVSRGSTVATSPRKDFRVELAMSLIRLRACSGLRASDVVVKMGCSRRLAELRFREITGQSILEAIRQVRFNSASTLLARTDVPVAKVARRCGWKSVPTFCIDFRREKGMTPEGWRRKEL